LIQRDDGIFAQGAADRRYLYPVVQGSGVQGQCPASTDAGERAPADTQFTLFNDQAASEQREITVTVPYVLHFRESVRGLSLGAPVEYRGIRLGTVKEIGFHPDVDRGNTFIAVRMDLEPRKVRWMLKVSWRPLSLERPVGEEEDSELGSFIEDENTPTPTQSAYQNLLREKVEEVLSTLTPREARILRLRFGLQNGRSYTLEEVGQKFGLTRERIRQIEGKALRRLRHPRRSRQLRDYLA